MGWDIGVVLDNFFFLLFAHVLELVVWSHQVADWEEWNEFQERVCWDDEQKLYSFTKLQGNFDAFKQKLFVAWYVISLAFGIAKDTEDIL